MFKLYISVSGHARHFWSFTGYVLYIRVKYSCRLRTPATMQRTQTLLRPLLTPKTTAFRQHVHSSASFSSSLCRPKSYAPHHLSAIHTGCLVHRAKEVPQVKGQIREESTQGSATTQEKENQTRAPWHREGSDMPPVARQRSAGAMTKG